MKDDGAPEPRLPPRARRRGRQASSEAESLPRYIATAVGLLVLVVAVGYGLVQMSQGGKSSPEPAAVPTAAPAAPAGPAAPPPPTARPGQGPVRTSSRVIEPSYTVAPGDTLATIATRFGTSIEALQSINNLADRNVLTVGQKLVIPNQN